MGLHEDLHRTTTKTKHQMQRRFLLNVVVSKSATIFQLLARKDQTLLIRRDAFLVLDLLLDILNGIRAFDIKRDGLACQGLHEDLHRATTKTKHQMQRRFLLNVVVSKSATIFQLLAREDQTLLIRRDAFLVLDL